MLIKLTLTFALLVSLVWGFGMSLQAAGMADGRGGPMMIWGLVSCGLSMLGIVVTWVVL